MQVQNQALKYVKKKRFLESQCFRLDLVRHPLAHLGPRHHPLVQGLHLDDNNDNNNNNNNNNNNLTIKNCDKTFRKNIIKRLKNTTFRCTLHHYQVKLKMQDCGYKYKNGQ